MTSHPAFTSLYRAKYVATGIKTTTEFSLDVIRSPEFRSGKVTTRFLENFLEEYEPASEET